MKRIVVLANLAMALVAALAAPLAAFADTTTPVTVSGTVTATDTPVITTSPIYKTTTRVNGTNVSGATVYFTYNGVGPTHSDISGWY